MNNSSVPTMKDRAMQALHKLALSPVAETVADGNSYGFRECRSCADAVAALFNFLSKPNSATWVLEADIKGCYDPKSICPASNAAAEKHQGIRVQERNNRIKIYH